MKANGVTNMAAGDRSLADVLQDIVGNAQEIVRSEVRLAKTEIREEAAQAKFSVVLLGVGAVAAILASLFLLLMIFHALALIMPSWAAALVVGTVLAAVASVVLTVGVRRFQKLYPAPERTVVTIKENVEWVKQLSK